jgi:hypothetical protein
MLPHFALAQNDIIQQTLENITENQDITMDYSELLEGLENLREQPININSDQINQLHNLFLISETQVENLKSYIQKNGALLTINELILIPGFTKDQIKSLSPFIEVKALKKNERPKLSNIFKYGHHDVLIRFQRVLESAYAYRPFSAEENLNSYYLGNPNKYYLKYKFNFSHQIQLGFTGEKDAGELFLKNSTIPSLSAETENYFKSGFDFNSFHLYAQNLGLIKQIVLGDYHLLFGQGLSLWTGLAFGKSSNSTDIKKFESFIKPNTSANENTYLRGGAIRLAKNRWTAVLFYSKNKQDASFDTDSEGREYIKTLIYTGFHRNISELSKKDRLAIQLLGGRLKYAKNNFSIGLTSYGTHFSKRINPDSSPEKIFDFRGNHLMNYGLDYEFRIWKARFYGELAKSVPGGKAFLGGLSLSLNSRVKFDLLYRNYSKDYQSLFSSAFAENSENKNEKGFFAGTSILLTKKFSLQAYADYFSFPWLKFLQDSPSHGVEYRAQIYYNHSRRVKMYLKYRYKQKEKNSPIGSIDIANYLQNETKSNWQYQIAYQINERFSFRNRIEFAEFQNDNNEVSRGYMLYQDISYLSKNQRLASHTRLAIFNTDSYDSAIYAYENDVLFAFSIPAYSGQGIRFYELIRYAINDKIDCWVRYSLSYYPNQTTISSGLDQIDGNTKSDFKLQVRIKI